MASVTLRSNHIKKGYYSRTILPPGLKTTDIINLSKNVQSSEKTIEGLCLTVQYLTRQVS